MGEKVQEEDEESAADLVRQVGRARERARLSK